LAANDAKCANVRAIGVIGGEFQSASSAQSAAKGHRATSPFSPIFASAAAVVADRRYQILEVFFVFETAVIEDVVTDLTAKRFLRGKRFCKKHRVCVCNDILERVGIR